MSFNVGDWVYHDCEVVQVVSMDGEFVTEVTDGYIRTKRDNIKCFPMTVRIKRIADEWMRNENKIMAESCGKLVRLDVIQKELEKKWEAAAEVADNYELLKVKYQDLYEFVCDVTEAIHSNRFVSAGGVAIF